MQRGLAEEPRQPLEVRRAFRRLYLPNWDLDFIRRALWKKLPIGGRTGHRVGSKLCPLCHKLEDHEHVLRHCRFSPFIFDTVRKAFGLVRQDKLVVEPSRVLLENPTLSLRTSQGLVLWAALKAQWALRCQARFQGAVPTLDDFVARRVGVMEIWRAKKDLSLSRVDLQHLIEQLFSWFTGWMFIQKAPAAGVYPAKPTATPGDPKEQRWGQYRDAVVEKLAVLEREGWQLVYTDGSAKQVRGWWQAGYGVWFGECEDRNVGARVPTHKRQSVSRGELRGVLYAHQQRRGGEDGGGPRFRIRV